VNFDVLIKNNFLLQEQTLSNNQQKYNQLYKQAISKEQGFE